MNVSGTGTLLILAWHAEYDGGPLPAPTPPDPGAWSVTNNGVPGIPIAETNGYRGGDGNRRFRIYYWLNPPPGINTVAVLNPNTGPNELDVSAMLFTNVNQATPLGNVVLDVSTAARASESETVSTTPTDLVVHVIANTKDNRGGILGPGETAISIVNDTFFKDDASLMISTKPGGNPSTTVSSSGWAPDVVNGVAIVLHSNSAGGEGSKQRRGQLVSD